MGRSLITKPMGTSDEEAIADMLAQYELGRYLRDPTIPREGARRYLLSEIMRYYLQHKDSCFVCEENGVVMGLICFAKSEWDTAHFGYNVGSVDFLLSRKLAYFDELKIKKMLMQRFRDWRSLSEIHVAWARIDDYDLAGIHALEDSGFRYIETTVTHSFDYRRFKDIDKARNSIRKASPEEIEILVDMARSSFVANRFHFDAHFDREKADELYATWVRNCCRNPLNEVTVLDVNRKPASFFVYEIADLSKYMGLRFGKWILAAVSPEYQGKGVGYQHYLQILSLLRGQVDINDALFSLGNTRVVNLYIKLGFRMVASAVTLHAWFGKSHHQAHRVKTG